MKISVIYPSRSRPEICKKTLSLWKACAKNPENIEWILSVDQDDPNLQDYVAFYNSGDFHLEISRNRSCVDAINIAAEISTGDLLVVISDDFAPCHLWDYQLQEALSNTWFGTDFIVKTSDGLQPWLITLPIVGRQYYERLGHIYPPHILHMFADTWMTHVADLLDKKLELNIPFEHLHFSVGKSQKDHVNVKNDRTWADGEAKYLEGVKTNFGLAPEDIKGHLRADFKLIQWLAERGVYVN